MISVPPIPFGESSQRSEDLIMPLSQQYLMEMFIEGHDGIMTFSSAEFVSRVITPFP